MFPKLLFIFLLSVVLCDKSVRGLSNNFREARLNHAATELSDRALSKLADKKNLKHFNEVLSNILVPRVVGTKEHDEVADYIVNTMEGMGWAVERLKFKDRTPIFGELEFQNIVAKLNPSAERQLVLACHYDSKYIKNKLFLGATDSAVPCAMMINLAYVMKAELDTSKSDDRVGLTFIFFDGEEAFETWSDVDSIYGAKNLASLWHKQSFRSTSGMANELDRIDVFVLLDLLGAKNPQFYSYFSNTARWFELLADNEQRLSQLGKLKRHNSQYFIRYNLQANIEDDHLPFLRKGVPILHLIPTPFPDVWHKMSDNRSAVDFTTVENLNKILRAFVAQYMQLTI